MKVKQMLSSWFNRPEKQLEPSSGQAIVLIGISAVALIAIMGLAIDGGRLLFLKRETQNAADAGAIAAARAMCALENDYVQKGMNAANANGFNNDEVADTVRIVVPPEGASITIGDNCKGCYVEVIVRGEIPASFVGLVYDGPLAATSNAIAACNPNQFPLMDFDEAALRAAWSIGESCETGITGSDVKVVGGLHANGLLKVNPATGKGTVVGPSSYVGSLSNSADKVDWKSSLDDTGTEAEETAAGLCRSACFNPPASGSDDEGSCTPESFPAQNPYKMCEDQADPLSLDIDDYKPGGDKANAAGTKYYYYTPASCKDKDTEEWLYSHITNNLLDEGLYYTTCDITINSFNDVSGNVTWVTEGQIHISGSSSGLTPFQDELLMYANYGGDKCVAKAIKFSGSSNSWTGNLYAPHGEIDFSASLTSTSVAGCVIGYQVTISSSNTNLVCQPGLPDIIADPGILFTE